MNIRVPRWSMLLAAVVAIALPSHAAAQLGCQPGRFASSQSGTCEECNVGRYQPAIDQQACFPCEAGRFADSPGRTACDACGAGRYQDATASTVCQDCSAGTFRDATGQTSCAACAAGRYSHTPAASSCDSCAPGRFSDIPGVTACATCGAGRYASDGAAACKSCDPGRYATDGSETCKSCGPGKYSGGAEAAACDTCPPGKFSGVTVDALGDSHWASACTAPNAFRCYKTKDLKSPPFIASEAALTDDFASDTVKIKGPAMVCAPIDLGSGVEDPSGRQCCYKITAPGLAKPHPRIRTSGGAETGSSLEVLKSQLICEPCGADPIP
jgi:hypothetical protein